MRTLSTLLMLLGTGTISAQVVPLVPFDHTLDLLVVDSTFDGVFRLGDRSQNGDYLGGSEITTFYDDVLGSIVLTNPSCIAVSRFGTAYVGDSTVDIVLALTDRNGDGDALDAGEHTVFFDSATNASGIVMASIQGITVAATDEIFAAVSNAGSSGTDMILRLADQNGDGDANDAGEATIYCQIPNAGTSVGDSIPTKVVVAPNLDVYYTDVGSTGVIAKGVWRLHDGNMDGDCNDPGEVTLFWSPPAPANAFYWSLAVGSDGTFYVTDHGNETIWRARDLDNSGAIDPSEENLFYQTSGSTWWDVVLRDDGVVLVCEDQTPDRITALVDLNADGDALDPNESYDVYDATLSATAVRPRGAALMRGPSLSVAPATVQVGNSATVVIEATRPGDLVVLAGSFGLVAPTPIAPFGYVELDTALLVSFGLSIANAGGQTTASLAVPNNPALVGGYGFQALAGDLFRPYLTNGALLTVTP
ncbi:MAG: hypothetical protein KDE27_12660 [Planctomycetes bacterium]|nr:hypothetical protein [Planctomycetota bacterium]